MKDILLYIWQLPQNLVGLVCQLIWPTQKSLYYKGKVVRVNANFPSGISLGNTIIVRTYPTNKYLWNTVKHEWGHTEQSRIYGWLYLFIVGIPSVCGNLWDRAFHKSWPWDKANKWYFNLPWEKGADKRGGVER